MQVPPSDHRQWGEDVPGLRFETGNEQDGVLFARLGEMLGRMSETMLMEMCGMLREAFEAGERRGCHGRGMATGRKNSLRSGRNCRPAPEGRGR